MYERGLTVHHLLLPQRRLHPDTCRRARRILACGVVLIYRSRMFAARHQAVRYQRLQTDP